MSSNNNGRWVVPELDDEIKEVWESINNDLWLVVKPDSVIADELRKADVPVAHVIIAVE